VTITRRSRWLAGAFALASLWGPGVAHALPLDIQLRGLGPVTKGGDQTPANNFRLLVSEIGFALTPRSMAPATTTGLSGFEVSFDVSLVQFNFTQPYWGSNVTEQQRRTGSPPAGTQAVPGFHIRKGLPFSLEVEAHVNYLGASSMFMVGADLKYSFLEGYKYVPNISARAGVNRLLNAQEIDLTTVNLDITLSKSIPLGGVLELTPIVGYGILFMNMNSAVLDTTPENTADNISLEQPGGSLYTMPEQPLASNFHHRVYAGLELHTFIFTFMYQFDAGFVTGGKPVYMNTLKLGLQF
jgi:hypothetical protein